MANDLNGLWTVTQVTNYLDSLATVVKNNQSRLGQAIPGETGTLASDFYAALRDIVGDGTTTYPGLGQPLSQGKVRPHLEGAVKYTRHDTIFNTLCREMMNELDAFVRERIPDSRLASTRGQWTMTDTTYTHPFDTYLLRANATASPTVGTPASPTLTAIGPSTNTGGRMGEVSGSNRPYVVYTYVGDKDWKESIPSAEVQIAALAAPNNAVNVAIAGNVPTGVTKIRIYRSLYGSGSAATKYWVKDVTAKAGASHPTIHLLENDLELRDYRPPSWCSCLIVPEAAYLYALAFATLIGDVYAFDSTAMLSPQNVALAPANGFLGLGNIDQHGIFVTAVESGFTLTQGSIQTSNIASGGIQGFAGAYGLGTGGLRARVTSAINSATTTVTIDYTYYDATNGWGNAQNGTGLVSDQFTGTAIDSTATFDVPAGRVVRSVTPTSSTPTSGEWLIEAEPIRSY